MLCELRDVLSRSQLKRLAEHKYSVEGVSLLEPYLQGFWRWLVEQIPLWWAPNALTLAGLVINVATTLILVSYSPNAINEAPGWSYFLCALGLFIYQALDAIDGKQARRTNSSSPLGELFDHGCDALSIVIVMVGTSITLQLGLTPGLMVFECFSSMFLYYAAHWQTFCSGTLRFGILDVTEAQISVMSLYVISAVFGASVWSTQLPWLGMELKMLPILFSIFGAILACYSNFGVILLHGGIGKNGSTVAGTSVISPMLPIGVLLTLGVTLWLKSTTHVFEQHIVLYVISIGLAATKITNKLVVSHMSRTEMDMLDTTLIGPGMLFLNQYFDTYLDEYYVLWACCLFCATDLSVYSVRLCRQMCAYLGIDCFTVSPPRAASLATRALHQPVGDPHSARNSRMHNNNNSSSHSRSSSSSSTETATRPLHNSAHTHHM